jgi:uncharacterized RDD family membrane protein YckC
MAPQNGQLDNRIDIVTPENIAFHYQVAGPFRRLPAYLVDLMIRIGLSVVSMIVLVICFAAVHLPDVGAGGGMICYFVIAWFYGGLFETFWNGQTPGKRLMDIRVLSVDGQPINGVQAVMRNLLRVIDGYGFYLVGLIVASMNNRFQRLGDLACGTMVVIEEPKWFHGVVRITEPAAIQLAAQIPAGFVVDRRLARGLAGYVQRRGNFAWPRRLEIARHLSEPLLARLPLPPTTDPDLLLAALYHRTFIADHEDGQSPWGDAVTQSPFMAGAKP